MVGTFANLEEPEDTVWTINGKQVAKASHYQLNTSDWAAGTYKLTAELIEGKCVAYDNRLIVINECAPVTPPKPVMECYDDDVLLDVRQTELSAGEILKVTRGATTGGQNYGSQSVAWFTSAGSIVNSNEMEVRIDTTGVAPETEITVRVEVVSTEACKAIGSTSLKLKGLPPVIVPVEIASCDTFKLDNARVDNACKNILMDVARQLQAKPNARLVVIGEQESSEKGQVARTRAQHVKSALSQGAAGITIDANRIDVKTQAGSSKSVRLILVP